MNSGHSEHSKLPGSIYGVCTYWITIAGMIVSFAGIIFCFTGNSQFTKCDTLMEDLWAGKNPSHIWKSSSDSEILSSTWNMRKLSSGDGIAMLGITICCFAGLVGAWGSFAAMVIQKESSLIFQIFAFTICLLLTGAACGLISLH